MSTINSVERMDRTDEDGRCCLDAISQQHKVAAMNQILNTEKETSKPGEQNSQLGKENQKQLMNLNQESQHEQFCYECHRSLSKSRHLVNISGQMHRWHSECFRCYVCGQLLDKETSCHLYRERIVCREDYARLQRENPVRCARCAWPINASDWVRRASSYIYHLACFSCDICLRLMSTGEQFTVHIQESDGSVKLLCRLHFAIEPSQSPIQPSKHPNPNPHSLPHLQHTLQHSNCEQATSSSLTCAISRRNSTNNQIEDGDLDSLRDNLVEASSMPQLGNSSTPLPTSSQNFESFHFDRNSEQSTLSKSKAIPSLQDQTQYMQFLRAGSSSVSSSGLMQLSSRNKVTGLLQISTPPSTDENIRHRTSTASSSSSTGSTSGQLLTPGGTSKSKRVRTTFTEDQLETLQRQFEVDSNPDGQQLEDIATITGLSKRVTQVWFQNSRARQKKHMFKRKPNTSSSLSLSNSLQQFNVENCHGEPSVGSCLQQQQSLQQPSTWSSHISDHSNDLSLDITVATNDQPDDSQQSASDNNLALSDNSDHN